MDAVTNWPAVVLVLLSALVSGTIALAAAYLTNRAEQKRLATSLAAQTSQEWLRARLAVYSKVIQHAHGFWSSYDDDGAQRPGSDPIMHYESFKRAYASASLICEQQATDKALGNLEDALGHLRLAVRGVEPSTPERYAEIGDEIAKTIDVFQTQAREELQVGSLTPGGVEAKDGEPTDMAASPTPQTP